MSGVARYEDLDCWKLAMELADMLDAMTAGGEPPKPRSAPRPIAPLVPLAPLAPLAPPAPSTNP